MPSIQQENDKRPSGGSKGERGRACIPKRLNLKNKWRCSNTNWCMADDSNRTHSKLLSIYDSTNDIDLLESDRTFIARHPLINKHLLRSKSISVILHTNDIDGGRRWHCSMLDFEILKWNIKLPMLTHKLSESRSNVLGELNWPPPSPYERTDFKYLRANFLWCNWIVCKLIRNSHEKQTLNSIGVQYKDVSNGNAARCCLFIDAASLPPSSYLWLHYCIWLF